MEKKFVSKAVYENSKKEGNFFCFDEDGCYTVYGFTTELSYLAEFKKDIKDRIYYPLVLEEKVSGKGVKYYVFREEKNSLITDSESETAI